MNESLVTVFHSHLRHIEQAVRAEKLKNTDPKFVQKNAAFLLDTLLSLVNKEIHHFYLSCKKTNALVAALGSESLAWSVQQEPK